jgi:cytochrome P450
MPAYRRDPLALFTDAARRFGDLVEMPFGPRTNAYLVSHPDLLKTVLQDRHTRYGKEPRTTAKLEQYLGQGLLTSDGELWLRQRRLIQPAFHRRRVDEFGELMVEEARTHLDRWQAGQPFDLFEDLSDLTLRIIGRAMFGADVGAFSDEFHHAVNTVGQITTRRLMSYLNLPYWLPTPDNLAFNRARGTLDGIVHGLIRQRRHATDPGSDLLGMLLEARDEESGQRMDDRQVRDEVLTIFLAGHVTTAVGLSWTNYLLATHADVRERLGSEVNEAFGGAEPAIDSLDRAPGLGMTIDESMRLYPPAWVMTRRAKADEQLGGFDIPAGSMVILSIYLAHRHPAFWPDPGLFDPSRFASETAAGRHRFAFAPFGGGPHQCIGNGFALLEMRIILAMLLQRWRLDLAPGARVDTWPMITLRPRNGMWMVASRG